MKITANEAMQELENGNENKAWEIAQQDEGLLPTVTKSQWIAYAKKCIARRNAQNKANDGFYLD